MLEPDPSGAHRERVPIDRLVHQSAQVNRFPHQVLRRELAAGAKVLDEPLEPMQLTQQSIDRRRVWLDDLVADSLGMPAQHSERRPQLVRHGVHQSIPLPLESLQIRTELLKGSPKVIQLADSGRRQVEVALAGSHAACGSRR